MASWKKTQKGEWVVCGTISEVVEGGISLVTRRDGTTSEQLISRTGRPFERDGAQMVYGYPASSSAARPHVSESSYDCGHRIGHEIPDCFCCQHQIGL